VLVNTGTDELAAEVIVPAEQRLRLVNSEITRTVFDGLERSAVLGALPPSGVVRVPGRSIVTVALTSN
jgi:hypothetical protein